jgi:hypothetical protein
MMNLGFPVVDRKELLGSGIKLGAFLTSTPANCQDLASAALPL